MQQHHEDRPEGIEPTVELLLALGTLDPIEREVWVDRHILRRTLQAIADEFALRDPATVPHPRNTWPGTRERIRQLESQAAKKIERALLNNENFLAKIEDPKLKEKILRR